MPRRIRAFSEDKAFVQERRKHIVISSVRVLVKKGYARTNVGDLAKACKMGRGTLYHYVGSKDDIVYLIVKSGISEMKDLTDDLTLEVGSFSPAEALHRAVERYYRLVDKLQDHIMFGIRETVYLSMRDRKELLTALAADVSFFEGLLERGIKAGEFKINNARVLAYDIVSRGQAWATGRWFLRGQATLDEYIKAHSEWLFKAIGADKDSIISRGEMKQNVDILGC